MISAHVKSCQTIYHSSVPAAVEALTPPNLTLKIDQPLSRLESVRLTLLLRCVLSPASQRLRTKKFHGPGAHTAKWVFSSLHMLKQINFLVRVPRQKYFSLLFEMIPTYSCNARGGLLCSRSNLSDRAWTEAMPQELPSRKIESGGGSIRSEDRRGCSSQPTGCASA